MEETVPAKRIYKKRSKPGPKPKRWNAKAKARQKRYLKKKEEANTPAHIKEMITQIKLIEKDIAKARRKMAVKGILINDKKLGHIVEKPREEITIREAEYALKAIDSTEFSGKKSEEPRNVINVMEGATANIQQNISDINKILERSGIDIDEVLRTVSDTVEVQEEDV